jgi:hypothetical protein
MSFFRPIHWYHSRVDLIWPVGPFNGEGGLKGFFFVLAYICINERQEKLSFLGIFSKMSFLRIFLDIRLQLY